jgi:hypothetical protein
MAKIIYAASKFASTGGNGSANNAAAAASGNPLAAFADGQSIGAADRDAIAYCVNAGIINGITAGGDGGAPAISPDGVSTRAQAAAVILRALKSLDVID